MSDSSQAEQGYGDISRKDGIDPDDPGGLAKMILEKVQDCGAVHVRLKLSEQAYDSLVRRVGTVELRTDIRVDRERAELERPPVAEGAQRPAVNNPSALGFHTDRPSADMLAWFCVQQDAEDGTLSLIDARDLHECLEERHLKLLQSVPVSYHSRRADGNVSIGTEPLLTKKGSGYVIYFAPWLMPSDLDPELSEAIGAFERYIAHKSQASCWHIRLEPGESLYIDNRRLLHGRGALAEHSRRHLVRYYLQVPQMRSGSIPKRTRRRV